MNDTITLYLASDVLSSDPELVLRAGAQAAVLVRPNSGNAAPSRHNEEIKPSGKARPGGHRQSAAARKQKRRAQKQARKAR